MSKRQQAKVYRDAAKLIETCGWLRGSFGNPDIGFCAVGGLEHAAYKAGLGPEVRDSELEKLVIKKLFGDRLPRSTYLGPGVIYFNDACAQSAEEICRVLRGVARALEHGGKV